ncbi:interferon a3-like [Kryptolebias marmoratus]|uniref:Interferon a3-like n=1 Tax=Kryptolebias marmoratus TaxID=37003 RepID=A0A3Q3F5E8_KRYMA|nr:interferon a3-like [Kryptolebias marmoratus]
MLSRVLFACLFLGLYGACASLSCRWMDHKFRQFSENSLNLLEMMGNNSTNSTEDEEESAVAFPHHLYGQAARASAEEKVAFTAQVLKEVSALLEEDDGSSSWEEVTAENFLSVVNKQAEELLSCKKNTKLHLYFRRLSAQVLKKRGHSAEAWELIRREVRGHLMRADHLISSLLAHN